MQASVEKRGLPEKVELMVLDASGALREDVGLDELPRYLEDPNALVWCDVYSSDGGKEGPYAELLTRHFGFDELTVEDCFTASHLPKVDDYGGYLFMALFSFHVSEKTGRVQTVEVDMYVGENYVVCVHPRPLREMSRVRRRLLAGDRFVSASAANVAHTVVDAIVDEYLPIMDQLAARVDDVEERLLSEETSGDGDALDRLFGLKHLLTSLRRLAIPQRDAVTTLLRPTTTLIPEEAQMHFQDVRDHLNRVVDSLDTMRDYLSSALEIYNTRSTHRINQGIQKLTAISTVVLPLTLITSVYGMNFENMPELGTEYGYFVVLGVLVVLGALMLYYLRRSKMI